MALGRVLWIGAALVAGAIAGNYGLLGVLMWLRSRPLLGPVTAETRRTLRRLLDVSRQGNSLKLTRVVLLYAGLAALAVAFAAGEWLGLVIAAAPFVLSWWLRVRTTTPPSALLLGASTHSSVRRQREVKARVSPLRVVSLLEVEVPWDRGLGRELALDCFRTANEDDWWEVITRLLEMSPVIAIDTAAETVGVLREARHILTTGIERKCLFMTPPDGSAPVLDRLLPAAGPGRQGLRLASYEEAPRVIAAMVAQLGGARAGEPRGRE